MIAVVGSTHDDILYFESIMANKRKEVLFNRFDATIGTIFNQEVILVHQLYTSVLSSAVITHILNKFYISLVFNVGRCVAVDPKLKIGDIIISNKVIDVNVDLVGITDSEIGQIPGFRRVFEVQNDIINYTKDGVHKRTFASAVDATFLSSDNLSDTVLTQLKEKRSIFGVKEELVFDSTSAGVALACHLADTPFIIVKSIEKPLEKDTTVDDYLKVLDSYINLGKAVVSTIGDIGRADILKGGFVG